MVAHPLAERQSARKARGLVNFLGRACDVNLLIQDLPHTSPPPRLSAGQRYKRQAVHRSWRLYTFWLTCGTVLLIMLYLIAFSLW